MARARCVVHTSPVGRIGGTLAKAGRAERGAGWGSSSNSRSRPADGSCVEGVPPDSASDEEKNERTLALVEELKTELPEIEPLTESAPREALMRLWVLRTYLESHPLRWVRNYAHRPKWNELNKQIDALRERAGAQLPDDQAKTVWQDLPYVREAVGLLFDKLRAQGEVQRLILTPLGKLTFAKVRYQREGPDDLTRVSGDRGLRQQERRLRRGGRALGRRQPGRRS